MNSIPRDCTFHYQHTCWYNKVVTLAPRIFNRNSIPRKKHYWKFQVPTGEFRDQLLRLNYENETQVKFASLETLHYISWRVNLRKGLISKVEEIEREVKCFRTSYC